MSKVLFMFYHFITTKIVIKKYSNKTGDQSLARKLMVALKMGRSE
jgi:hypothetical protein